MSESVTDTRTGLPAAAFGLEAVRSALPGDVALTALGELSTDAKWDRKELTLTVAPESIVAALFLGESGNGFLVYFWQLIGNLYYRILRLFT